MALGNESNSTLNSALGTAEAFDDYEVYQAPTGDIHVNRQYIGGIGVEVQAINLQAYGDATIQKVEWYHAPAHETHPGMGFTSTTATLRFDDNCPTPSAFIKTGAKGEGFITLLIIDSKGNVGFKEITFEYWVCTGTEDDIVRGGRE